MTDSLDPARRIVYTGAAGGVGTMTRLLLAKLYPGLVLSDRVKPANLLPSEKFEAADLTKPEEVAALVKGAHSVIHLGGHSVEGTWDQILNANIIGCYNLFEAARAAGVKRVIFASSNHAIGFYPRKKKIGTDVTVRPDSRYGVSKAFGEALGSLYSDKHGIGVTCLRIGNVGPSPLDVRRLSIWISPGPLTTHPIIPIFRFFRWSKFRLISASVSLRSKRVRPQPGQEINSVLVTRIRLAWRTPNARFFSSL